MDYREYGKSTANISVAPTATSAVESTPIRDEVTQAEQALSALHDAISQLESRLDTALRPMPPQGQGSAAGAPSNSLVRSHLVGRLSILNDGFQGAVLRLRELTSRVEV